MKPPTHIKSDPFARRTLYRWLKPAPQRSSCDWCGSRSGKFVYSWVRNDRAVYSDLPLPARGFCSLACWDEFYPFPLVEN